MTKNDFLLHKKHLVVVVVVEEVVGLRCSVVWWGEGSPKRKSTTTPAFCAFCMVEREGPNPVELVSPSSCELFLSLPGLFLSSTLTTSKL